MRSLPSGVVTLLFTDIEGSTTMLERAPEAYREALRAHHRLLDEAIERHGGQVFERLGDGVYASFARSSDAVAAAVEAQIALNEHDWASLGELRVRMAVHAGELDRWDDRYFGPALYRCARLLAVGHGGQTLLSAIAAEIAGGALPPEAWLRDLGTHRLKDLRAPEHIFQLAHPRLRAEFPPLRSLDAHPHNIPLQLTSFIGRERELEAVRSLLGESRLVTLTGPGGSGKTRLALQLAAEAIDRFEDGVFVVELAPIADPPLVLPTIAKTLGIKERVGTPLADDVKSYLREKALLLVVDNFEHVVPAAQVIQDLLRSAPKLRVLATSREVLHLAGERDFAVPPLPVPSDAAAELGGYAAIRLFVDRAQAARPGFVLDGEGEAVVKLCRRLDGLPLAIELAAARASVLKPREILERLDDRLALLDRGSRDLPERQRTLRAAIDWSYELLSADERHAFARLAVFAGDFALEAAEEVSDFGDLSSPALDLITSLVDKSLVERTAQSPHEARLRMLETVRAYARQQLQAMRELDEARERHAMHYVKLAEIAEPRLRSAEQIRWLDRLDRELDNIRAALAAKTVRLETRLRLASALWRFCFYRGHLSEAHSWLSSALEEPGDVDRGVRAKAMFTMATVLNEMGEPDLALCHESLALRKEIGDREGIAWSTLAICNALNQERETDEKRACYEEALALFKTVGERWGYARSLGNLGGLLPAFGEIEQAVRMKEEALALFREVGDDRQIASELASIANHFLWRLGDPTRAREPLREALLTLSRVGDARSLGSALLDLCFIEMRAGEYTEALQLAERALATGKELGDRVLMCRSSMLVGWVRSAAGDYAGAESPLRDALSLAEGGGDAGLRKRGFVMGALSGLGINAFRAGDLDQALALHSRALAVAREIGSPPDLWAQLGNLGVTHVGRGEHAKGAAYFKEELVVTRQLGIRRDLHEPFEGLAVIAEAADDSSTAALLAGAADALRRASGERMLAPEAARYLPVLERLRADLGPEEFAKHWDQGQKLGPDDAIDQALRVAERYAVNDPLLGHDEATSDM